MALRLIDGLVLSALLAGIHLFVSLADPTLKRNLIAILGRADGDGDVECLAFEAEWFAFDSLS